MNACRSGEERAVARRGGIAEDKHVAVFSARAGNVRATVTIEVSHNGCCCCSSTVACKVDWAVPHSFARLGEDGKSVEQLVIGGQISNGQHHAVQARILQVTFRSLM